MFPGNSPCFSWLNKETLWPLRYLETFSPQITKKVDKQHPFFDSVQTLMNQIFAEHAARRRRSTIKSVQRLLNELYLTADILQCSSFQTIIKFDKLPIAI